MIWNICMADVGQIELGDKSDGVQHELLSVYDPLPVGVRDILLDTIHRFHADQINFKQAKKELTQILQDEGLNSILKENPDFFKAGNDFIVAYIDPIIESVHITAQLFLHARNENTWTFGALAKGLKLVDDPNKAIEDTCSKNVGALPLMLLQMQHHGLYDEYKSLFKEGRLKTPLSLKKAIEVFESDREEALSSIRIVVNGGNRNSIFTNVSGSPQDPYHPNRKYVYGTDTPKVPMPEDISLDVYQDVQQLLFATYGRDFSYKTFVRLHNKIKERVGADRRLDEKGCISINSKYIFPGFDDEANELVLLTGAVLTSPLRKHFEYKMGEGDDISVLLQEEQDAASSFYNKNQSKILSLLDRLNNLGLLGYFELMLFETDHVLPTKLFADKLNQWKKLRIPQIKRELGLDIIAPDPRDEGFKVQLADFGHEVFKRDEIPAAAIDLFKKTKSRIQEFSQETQERKNSEACLYYFGVFILSQHKDFETKRPYLYDEQALLILDDEVKKFNALGGEEHSKMFAGLKSAGLWGLFMRGLKDREHSPFSEEVLEAAKAFEKPIAAPSKPKASWQVPVTAEPKTEPEEPKTKRLIPKNWKKDLSIKFGAQSASNSWGGTSDYDARYVQARKNIRAREEAEFRARTGFDDSVSNDNEHTIPDGFPLSLKDKLFFPKDGATVWGDGEEKYPLLGPDDKSGGADEAPEFRWKFVLKALQGMGVTDDQILGVYNPQEQEFIFDIETPYGRSQIIVDDYREIFVVRDNAFKGEHSLPFHRREKKLPDGTFEDIGNKMYLLDNRYAWSIRLRAGSEALQDDLAAKLLEERDGVKEQVKRQVSWTSNERGIQFASTLVSTVIRTSKPPKTQDTNRFEFGPLANLSGATPSKAYGALKRGSVPVFEKENISTYGDMWNAIVKLEPELDSFWGMQPLQAHDVFQTVANNIAAGRAVDDFSHAVGSCKARKAKHVSLAIKYDGIPSINEALKKAGKSQAAQDSVVDFESLMEATDIAVKDSGRPTGWFTDEDAADHILQFCDELRAA